MLPRCRWQASCHSCTTSRQLVRVCGCVRGHVLCLHPILGMRMISLHDAGLGLGVSLATDSTGLQVRRSTKATAKATATAPCLAQVTLSQSGVSRSAENQGTNHAPATNVKHRCFLSPTQYCKEEENPSSSPQPLGGRCRQVHRTPLTGLAGSCGQVWLAKSPIEE